MACSNVRPREVMGVQLMYVLVTLVHDVIESLALSPHPIQLLLQLIYSLFLSYQVRPQHPSVVIYVWGVVRVHGARPYGNRRRQRSLPRISCSPSHALVGHRVRQGVQGRRAVEVHVVFHVTHLINEASVLAPILSIRLLEIVKAIEHPVSHRIIIPGVFALVVCLVVAWLPMHSAVEVLH